jgi:hypothetical protein
VKTRELYDLRSDPGETHDLLAGQVATADPSWRAASPVGEGVSTGTRARATILSGRR